MKMGGKHLYRAPWKRWSTKVLAWALIAALVGPMFNTVFMYASASEPSGDGLCPHHPEHTEECGWATPVEAVPCGHVHDADCGWIEPVCLHVHDETCGYAQAVDEIPCDLDCQEVDEEGNIVHSPECAYAPAVEPVPCGHTHDADCGFTVPAPAPCGHIHDGACGYIEPVCLHAHDETCGYTEAADEVPCDQGCEDIDGDGVIDHGEDCAYTPATEAAPCGHVHDADCGFLTSSPCGHVHDDACGYVPPACAHQHDGVCGYAEAVEGTPCSFRCGLCVTGWRWIDDSGVLAWSEDGGLWGLGLPGAGEDAPVTREFLTEILPQAVTAETAAGSLEVGLVWDLSAVPEEGAYDGSLTLTAALDGDYVLTERAPALEVLLDLGEGELYADYAKYLNHWSFITRDGSKVEENSLNAVLQGLSTKSPAQVIQWLKDSVLPTKIRGWVSSADSNGVFTQTGFTFDTDQSEKKFEMTENGWGTKEYQSPGYQWGRIGIQWDESSFPTQFSDGLQFTLRAVIPSVTSGSNSYSIYVNSNDPADYVHKGADGNPDRKDTKTNPGILTLSVTIYDVDLSNHIVPPAHPQNVTVNLFDYWVADYGEVPAAPQGDILPKGDWHFRPKDENAADTELGTYAVNFSTQQHWYQGINAGHLLMFGDGVIHAGLWNKGAGENTRYGKKYAGMEKIVQSVLVDGYPVINTAKAETQMMGVTDSRDPNYREHTLIRDYRLAGDHIGGYITDNVDSNHGMPYAGADIQNLSKSLIAAWEKDTGKDIHTDTESLDYLFEPSDGSFKKSYTNVTGLFQLDNDGYYYYDMRKNFAEFDQGRNSFILYDAPATVRTDGEQSIGNFFPFNKGSEVFTGKDDSGRLTSAVDCSYNAMNHHLGMTVDIDFRQPANGRIGAGLSSKPMTFGFAGDDDVWVFIDDVLVLDLGGTHSEIYGTIDFSTGEVCIGRAFDTKGIPDDPTDPGHLVTRTNLLALYQEAGQADATLWNGNTFASNTSHTLKMFYLERGNYDSSIALRFNLQPLLYQRIEKVDQDGQPLPNVTFTLHPAQVAGASAPNAIQCLYTDASVNGGSPFYVAPDYNETLVTLKTDEDGSAMFLTPDGSYFNFADRGNAYYVLREASAPSGYRRQPIDIVLHYDTSTSMLSVANRWTTGAYACSISNVTGPMQPKYGQLVNGDIQTGAESVSPAAQAGGLVVAVPMLKKQSNNSWMALHGSNLHGFDSVAVNDVNNENDWTNALLRAALEQARDSGTADWHLEWDDGNGRLYGMLYDLPGLAERYQLNNAGGDMRMVYTLVSPAALADLNISGDTAAQRYAALRAYVRDYGVEDALGKILSANGFRFLSVDQFNRTFRSLIYMPNERRELRVMKVDQDGQPLAGAEFTLYDAAGKPAASGVTGADGTIIFSPTGANGTPGQAQMVWANSANTQYTLKETKAPAGYGLNPTEIPVVVGTYGIYADAGQPNDGVKVMAGVGRLTQTMRQYAMGNSVDVTLQDITAFMQTQPSGAFSLTGWQDGLLAGTNTVRSMNLHFGKNAEVDYGLHDEDGGKFYKPFFVTDTGYVRTRVQQNWPALTGGMYEGADQDANKENLSGIDLTNLFSLLNVVVVTDQTDSPTGQLTISKKVTGPAGNYTEQDYMENFTFTVELMDADGKPLEGSYQYRFYGEDKAGFVTSGGTLLLHHDESVTILGLPQGTRWTVTEVLEPGSNWYVKVDVTTGSVPPPASPASGSGTIVKDRTDSAVFSNSKDPHPEPPKEAVGDLTIIKRVTGSNVSDADRAKDFTFTVTLAKADGTALTGKFDYEYTPARPQKGQLQSGGSLPLHDGESVTIKGLPEGTVFTVTEKQETGWQVSVKPATGTAPNVTTGAIDADKTATVTFTNQKEPDTPGPNPTPTPTPGTDPGPDPTPTPTPGTDPGPDPTPTPTPGTDPGPDPTPTPTPGTNPKPTPTPGVDPSPTPDPSSSASPSPSVTPDPSSSASPSPSVTPDPSSSASPSPSVTPDPSSSASPSPSSPTDDGSDSTPPAGDTPKQPDHPGGPDETDLPDDGTPREGADAPETPATWDGGTGRLWMALSALSAGALAVIYFTKLRRKEGGE